MFNLNDLSITVAHKRAADLVRQPSATRKPSI
jgi:hypothetical protein